MLGQTKTIYVSKSGSDTGTGTASGPYASLQKAIDVANAGDTILMGPGVYTQSLSSGAAVKIAGKSGTAAAPITIKGDGGLAIIDGSPNKASWGGYALDIKNSSFITFENIGFTGAKQSIKDGWAAGVNVIDSSGLKFKGCAFFGNEGPGITIAGKSSGNLIINSDAHDNYDPLTSVVGGNADGFQFANILPGYNGNAIIDSRAWNNSDDGFDLYNSNSPITISGNEAWHNGYVLGTATPTSGDGDGFKLGKSSVEVAHTVVNNTSHDNKVYGFDSNGAKGSLILINNISYSNSKNYYMDDGVPYRLDGNISYDGGSADVLGNKTVGAGNAWGATGQASAAPAQVAAKVIWGTDEAETLLGGQGNDRLSGAGGNDKLKGDSGNDLLQGGSGADSLSGDAGADFMSGGSGRDILSGGDGNDVLVGGADLDSLTGGGGADVFLFRSANDAGSGKRRDVIQDFNNGAGDLIDLSGIDAVQGRIGDQAFAFSTSQSLSGAVGELVFNTKLGLLRGDTDGDGAANFEIRVGGLLSLSADHILL